MQGKSKTVKNNNLELNKSKTHNQRNFSLIRIASNIEYN